MIKLKEKPESQTRHKTALSSAGSNWQWLYPAGACLVLLAFFASLGKPLSKIGIIHEFDGLLNPSARFARFACIFDPSIYQLQAPLNVLTEKIWKSGGIPLWNPLNGCGYPMIGDPQTFAFSLLNFLFPVSNGVLYETGIFTKILIGAVFTYLLARTIGLARFASCFACLAFSLCPYYLWNLELPLNFFAYPLVFWLFARLARAPTATRALLTGVGCSFVVLSIHPECSFFSIFFGTVLCLALAGFGQPGDSNGWGRRLLAAAKALGLVAVTVFFLTAPMTFPFFEFLANSTNYKSESLQMGAYPLPWWALVLGLIQPVFAYESPFLGIVAIGLVPLAILNANRAVSGILLVAAASFVMVTQPGPAAAILGSPPLSVLLPVYCLPVFLLAVAVACAYGLQMLFNPERSGDTTVFLVGIFLALGIAPSLLQICAQQFPDIPLFGQVPPFLQRMCVEWAIWWDCLLAIAGVLMLVMLFGARRKAHWLLPVLFIALNVASQLRVAALAMYPFSEYGYAESRPIKFLSDSGQRCMATGVNLFLPNNNQRFGIYDFRLYNPFYPDRYLNFIRAAGAEKFDLYFHGFRNPMNRLLDLASVKYVVSREPVVADADPPLPLTTVLSESDEPTDFYPGVSLTGVEAAFDPRRSRISGRFVLKVTAPEAMDNVVQPLLLNHEGHVLWACERINIWPKKGDGGRRVVEFVIPVDSKLESVALGLRLGMFGGYHYYTPQSSSFSFNGPLVRLTEFDPDGSLKPAGETETGNSYQYRQVLADAAGVRIYENSRALPQAYLVHRALTVDNGDEALAMISSDRFNPRKEVVLENFTGGKNFAHDQSEYDRVELFRPDNNTVEIFTSSPSRGYLVLTDTWYPGWKAYLDGGEVAVVRGNYLFRAVEVPAGQHKVRFVYQPFSFWLGVMLAGAFIFLAGGWYLLRSIICKQSDRSPNRSGE